MEAKKASVDHAADTVIVRASWRLFIVLLHFSIPPLLSSPHSPPHLLPRRASPGQPYPGNRQPSSGPHAAPDSCSTHRHHLRRKTCNIFMHQHIYILYIYIPSTSTPRAVSRWLRVVFAVTSSGARTLICYSFIRACLSCCRGAGGLRSQREETGCVL